MKSLSQRTLPIGLFAVMFALSALQGLSASFRTVTTQTTLSSPSHGQQAFLLRVKQEIEKQMPSIAMNPAAERVAKRLQKRVAARFGVTPSIQSLANAVSDRLDLLGRSVLVTFTVSAGTPDTPPSPWIVSPVEHAHWVGFSLRGSMPVFGIDKDALARDIEQGNPVVLPHAADAHAVPAADAWNNQRMTLMGVPRSGYLYDAEAVADAVVDAFAKKEVSTNVAVEYRPARVILQDGRVLELLATGHSDFATSPAGREANVRKGLEERLDGVVIPAGSTFSFNSILGKGVSRASGWHDSLVIKDGYRLVPEPGGGICQVATTFYRAALLAGLPIPVRKNHSLFVHYYEQYGVGLDATVYIGAQDLKAVNDTGNDLFVQAYVNGTDAVVNVYGIRDGRTIAMQGPYFTANAPAGLTSKPLRANQIGWTRTVTRSDGQAQTDVILSSYNSVPRSIPTTYAQLDVVAEMHGAAPLPVEAEVAVQ
jgi:vancomycin resistance protein YoaR